MTKHTDEEIQAAADRLEQWLDTVDPDDIEWKDTSDLRAVAQATDTIAAGNAALREAVGVARLNGRSWGEIAIALGVSRQAARERFADKIRA
jgi:hypothetical protein